MKFEEKDVCIQVQMIIKVRVWSVPSSVVMGSTYMFSFFISKIHINALSCFSSTVLRVIYFKKQNFLITYCKFLSFFLVFTLLNSKAVH